jgi:inner membrane protein
MDPLAHTLVGAALGRTRLGRGVPYATVTLALAANAPDVDAFVYFAGEDAGLHWRRGWSHGPIGLVVLPLVLVLAVTIWSRWRRRDGGGPLPVGRLTALAYLGVLTHPALDWLNTYGIRLLSPFSDRWYYGDTLFIVDPWLWLMLGGALFLAHSATVRAVAGWAALGLVASLLVLGGPAPIVAKALWIAGLTALALARLSARDACRRRGAAIVTVAAAVAGVYVVAMLLSAVYARGYVLAELSRRGVGPVKALMVGPVPATPFRRDVVAQTSDGYRFGVLRFDPAPRLDLIVGERGFRPKPAADPLTRAALADPTIRGFVGWARFPYVETELLQDGRAQVWVLDARYVQGPPDGGRSFGAARVFVPAEPGTAPGIVEEDTVGGSPGGAPL